MPSTTESRAAEAQAFIQSGSRFMVLDNISKGLEPVLILLCARAYAGGDWGYFKYYESLVLLLIRLSSLGLDRGVIWIYSRCRDDAQFVQRFARAMNLVFLASSALVAFAVLQHLHYLPDLGSWTDKLPKAPPAQLALYLASVPVQACTLLFMQAFLNKKVLYFGMLLRNFAVPTAIYAPALLLSVTSLRSVGLALPYLLGNLLGLALAAYMFVKIYGASWKDWALSASASKPLLKFSLPLASTDFFMSFAYRVDFLLLARYGGIHEVEIYSIIVMISNTLRSLRQSMDGVMLSVFSGEAAGVIGENQKRNLNYASWVVLSLQVPFLFLALYFGRELLSLISPQYGGGYRVLIIATAFHLFTTIGAFSGHMLVGMGKTYMIPIAQIVFFLASLLFNFLLIPRYQAEGAALAMGLALTVGGLVSFIAIWKFAGSFILKAEFFLPQAAGILIFSGPAAVHFLLRPALPWDIALFLVSLALYAFHTRRYWKKFHVRPE
jgi:stage V sporulation protein B